MAYTRSVAPGNPAVDRREYVRRKRISRSTILLAGTGRRCSFLKASMDVFRTVQIERASGGLFFGEGGLRTADIPLSAAQGGYQSHAIRICL